ncbi:MAG: adenylate/guanylate cyclase domain-containing protein [Thermodesulfobacteriota bacterium]
MFQRVAAMCEGVGEKCPGLVRFWKRLVTGKVLIFSCGVLFSVIVSLLYVRQPLLLQFLDEKIYDVLLTQTAEPKTSGVPVICDLDERSLAEYGQWPWPRYRVALLLAKLRQAGAMAVGLDIVFAEPDNTSPHVLQAQLKRDLQLDMGFTNLPEQLMDNDLVLGGVLGSGPYVLGYFFNFKGDAVSGDCTLHPVSAAVKREAGVEAAGSYLQEAPSVICNIPPLSQSAPASGFFNADPDRDGILRRVPLLMNHKGGQIYPSLALATLMQATGLNQVVLKVASEGVESFKLGDTVIPVDHGARLMLKYRGPGGAFPYISASKVLGDRLQPDELKGKIVFIGTSAAGLKDIRTTPFDQNFAGVEAHATVVDNILTNDFIHRPVWAMGMEFLLIIVVGVLTTALLTWSSAALSVVPVVLTGAGLWFGAVYVMGEKGFYVSPEYPLLLLVGNFTLLTLIKFWREEGQKKFLHDTFKSYLSPELINQMFESQITPTLGGEAKMVTAFFSDIQGFSTFSEKLTATQVVELLNEYLTAMTDTLMVEEGTLDKYIGDAIVAFFNAPLDVPDHALRACRVAVGMQLKLGELRAKWASEKEGPGEHRNAKDLPEAEWRPGDKWPVIVHQMRMRIGLNTGDIVVGNMGSTTRMNYTMMGDAVNLAARLEAGAKQFGVYTLVAEAVLDTEFEHEGQTRKVRDLVEARFIDKITVVGKTEPVSVYEVWAMKGELTAQEQELYRIFGEAMAHYQRTEWDQAIEKFTQAKAIELVPEGKTTPAKVFLQRCLEYKANPPVPPGQPWDGVYRMTKK